MYVCTYVCIHIFVYYELTRLGILLLLLLLLLRYLFVLALSLKLAVKSARKGTKLEFKYFKIVSCEIPQYAD